MRRIARTTIGKGPWSAATTILLRAFIVMNIGDVVPDLSLIHI